MWRGGTLQSAECHPCTLVAECHTGISDSLRNFKPVVHKVSPQDVLPVLGAPRPIITNRSFWPACDQNLGSVVLRCDHESNFRNFDLERLRTFTPMASKVFIQVFLPLFGASRPKITNRLFWPSCDQMVLLTGVDQNVCSVFWPLCDQERPQKSATNGGLKLQLVEIKKSFE